MPSSESRNSTVKRDRIKEAVRNALWARTAGRCTICGRRLLGDTRTYLHSVLLAELAHNIGATGGDESPRREHHDGDQDTEAEENLLLLCHDCHKIIDDPNHVDLFPPDKLRGIKEAFERRVEMATENGGLARTAALRVGSRVRGSFVMASQREVGTTLLGINHLGLVETRRSGDFTCRISGEAGGRGYWEAGQQSLDEALDLVRQAVESGDVDHISIFAIAPIPLLVYLGWKLDDKTPARLFHKSRDVALGWSWADSGEPVHFAVSFSPGAEGESDDVVLICGVSSPVDPAILPPELAGAPRLEVSPVGTPPDPTLIRHEESLKNFATQWRRALAEAERRCPRARRWHLVASAPVTVAIEAGRAFMHDAHPPVTVYERTDNATYDGVLTVNGPVPT